MSQVWHLMRGRALLATLTEENVDQPWIICRFEPTAAFEEVRPLLERLVALVDSPTFDADAWEATRLELKEQGVVLRAAEGTPTLVDFGLDLRGSEAWLRY
jgi:hypothetical protein